MTQPHSSRGITEPHLLPDAVVALVDGELTATAQQRALTHIDRCAVCAVEVAAQRQARAEVRSASLPAMSPGFLASLRSIPSDVDMPSTPDHLVLSPEGQFMMVQRPDRVSGLGENAPLGAGAPLGGTGTALGTSTRLGNSPHVLGNSADQPVAASSASPSSVAKRRTVQGAGVVVSGLVLSALALVVTGASDSEAPERPILNPDVLRAQFGGGLTPTATSAAQTTTSTSVPATVTTTNTGTGPILAPQ